MVDISAISHFLGVGMKRQILHPDSRCECVKPDIHDCVWDLEAGAVCCWRGCPARSASPGAMAGKRCSELLEAEAEPGCRDRRRHRSNVCRT